MKIIVTGGIGSGKSTLLALARDRGFTTIDADDISHELSVPGGPLFRVIVDAFGAGVIRDGALDRKFLASLVFGNSDNLVRLNGLTHPIIGQEMKRRLDAAVTSAFVAIPLLRPTHRTELNCDEVWAVIVDPATALRRLVETRGMDSEDAARRMGSQVSNEARSALADVTLVNDGTEEELKERFDALVAQRGL